MTMRALNDLRWDGATGHYEVWFLTLTDRGSGLGIWIRFALHAPLDVLMKRVVKRDHRPLLKEDGPQAVMQRLMDERYPIYAEADLTIDTANTPHHTAVVAILAALREFLDTR